MPTKNHFAVLGIDIGADENQVKKAYRTLAKKWHPDKNKDAGAKEKFQEIAASYEYLSSTDRREMLERELRRAAAAPPPPKPQPPQQQQQQQPQQRQQYGTGYNNTSFTNGSQSTGPSSTKASSSTKSSKPQSGGSAKSKHWSDSFTKNNRKSQQHKTGAPGGTSSEKTDQKSRAQPKFSFRSYVSTPSDEDDEATMFQELFGDFFYNASGFTDLSGRPDLSGVHSQGRQRPGRTRNVAHETGFADGLDNEYMFSPRRDNEDSTEKLPCPWCGQLFTRGKLNQHEEKCGKFGLSADEDEGDDDGGEDDGDFYGGYDSDDVEDDLSYYSGYSSNLGQRGYARRPSWQQTHEETRSKIRRDKMRFRDRVASQGTRNSGFVTCPYCLRDFSSEAGAKHMPWCKEHTARFGRPLNPKPDIAGAAPRNRGGGAAAGGAQRGRGMGAATGTSGGNPVAASSRPAARDKTSRTTHGDFPGFGPFSQKEDLHPPRTGNDQPFPTHGPRIPDMFNVRGTNMAAHRSQARGPNVTIGLGRGPKISVGISTKSSSAKDTGNQSGPSATFTAEAGRGPNGAFKVRLNLNTNFDRKNKPGSYASSFGTKR